MSGETTVNRLGDGRQFDPDLARLADGGFVVAYASRHDESTLIASILGQRFDSEGARVGGAFVISDPAEEADQPVLAALEDGGFAVAWRAFAEESAGRSDLKVATFDANGAIRRLPLQVNAPQNDLDWALTPDVAATGGGGFEVVWSADEPAPGPIRSQGIYGRTVDSRGIAAGPERLVSEPRDFAQKGAKAALLDTGDVVVIYDSRLSTTNEVGNPVDDVRGRLLGPGGVPRGPEFLVSSENAGLNRGGVVSSTDLAVAALPLGRFVAVWRETELGVGGAATRHLFQGRVFEADGVAAGAEFTVNQVDRDVPGHASVAALDGGGFVVVWERPTTGDFFTFFDDVVGRVFDSAGRAVTDEFEVAQRRADDQDQASVIALGLGGFAVAWASEAADFDSTGIALRLFARPAGLGLVGNGSPLGEALVGGAANDILDPGGGADRVAAGAGDDIVLVRPGDVAPGEELRGNLGVDVLRAGVAGGVVTGLGAALVAGFEELELIGPVQLAAGQLAQFTRILDRNRDAGEFDLRLVAPGTVDLGLAALPLGVPSLAGSMGADVLMGPGGQASLINGRSGADWIRGGGLADSLSGGVGRDVLLGLGGGDALVGGAGPDRFVYRSVLDSTPAAAGRDRIGPFEATDVIDLWRIDANWLLPGNQAYRFVEDGPFTGTAGELRYRLIDQPGTAADRTILEGNNDAAPDLEFAIAIQGLFGLQQTNLWL